MDDFKVCLSDFLTSALLKDDIDKLINLSAASLPSFPHIIDHCISNFSVNQSSTQFNTAAATKRLYVMNISITTTAAVKRI
jgi:hypothetical protein